MMTNDKYVYIIGNMYNHSIHSLFLNEIIRRNKDNSVGTKNNMGYLLQDKSRQAQYK